MTVDTQRSGIDLTHLDPDVRPQDDLFGHLNGRWLAGYAMPADRATDGAFRALYDQAEEHVRDIITEAAAATPKSGPMSNGLGICMPASSTSRRWRRGD